MVCGAGDAGVSRSREKPRVSGGRRRRRRSGRSGSSSISSSSAAPSLARLFPSKAALEPLVQRFLVLGCR